MEIKKEYLRRRYQVDNSKEAIYLEEELRKFDGEYEIKGNGGIIIELGEKNHVNIRPLNKFSKIEEITSKKEGFKSIWKSEDRFEVKILQIEQTEYYVSNNPRHHPR